MTTDINASIGAALPKSLGRYKIVAELGRGAMGTVFHGIDETIERPVALKTLNAELPPEVLVEVRERFLREAKSAGQLNHPNIVTIYEFGQDAGTAFIAMEFLEGKSLQAVIREGQLPFDTIADYVAQIAEGLDYAHRFGVVHRDIKPANIMISSRALAKITDFGIARVQSSSMTQTGAMLGSPKYMSPEQVLGQPADGRADIFSLGVVLFEMLAARTPFETPDATVFSLMQRIVTVAHEPITVIAPGTPPVFEAILARALAKKPDKRYENAGQMADDLRRWKNGPAPAAASTGAPKAATATAAVASRANAPAAHVSAAPAQFNAAAFEKTEVTNPAINAAAYERTLVTHPGTASTAALNATLIAPPTPLAPVSLLDDLDTLGSSVDEMQRKFLEEEASAMAAMRRKASKSKDWDAMAGTIEAETAKDAPFASNAANATDAAGAARKSSVFGLLRQQAGPNLKEQTEARQAAETAGLLAFDAKLRAGYSFLNEFFREVNDANPQYAAQHSLLFYGNCPPLYFEAGAVNMRTKRIEDRGKLKDIIDHLIVSYQLISPAKHRVTLNGQEWLRLRDILTNYEMQYQVAETRNDFGQVTRAVVDMEIKFVCAITLRADYAQQRADLTCRNIGPLGRRRYQVPAAMLGDEIFDEISKVMLGYPSALVERFSVAV